MRYVIALLAFAGAIVSALALQVHYSTDTQPCSINEKWDCGIVNHSPYAVIGPVPVAAIGIAGYAMIALLSLARQRWLLSGVTMFALAFSLYLAHLEKDILMVWCLYCVISLGIISLITILSLVWAAVGRETQRRTRAA
jgi:vitamin-K-epoxide reductase (warfarin-sensitive)